MHFETINVTIQDARRKSGKELNLDVGAVNRGSADWDSFGENVPYLAQKKRGMEVPLLVGGVRCHANITGRVRGVSSDESWIGSTANLCQGHRTIALEEA